MQPDERMLLEWARNLHYPNMAYAVPSVMGRIQDDGPDGAVQKANVASDGGMAAKVDRWYAAIMFDRRCAETGEVIARMTRESRDTVDATYRCPTVLETPRTAGAAAFILEVSERTYYTRKKKMLEEFAALLSPAKRAA